MENLDYVMASSRTISLSHRTVRIKLIHVVRIASHTVDGATYRRSSISLDAHQ